MGKVKYLFSSQSGIFKNLSFYFGIKYSEDGLAVLKYNYKMAPLNGITVNLHKDSDCLHLLLIKLREERKLTKCFWTFGHLHITDNPCLYEYECVLYVFWNVLINTKTRTSFYLLYYKRRKTNWLSLKVFYILLFLFKVFLLIHFSKMLFFEVLIWNFKLTTRQLFNCLYQLILADVTLIGKGSFDSPRPRVLG